MGHAADSANAASSELLKIETSGRILTVGLNRPAKRNALNDGIILAIGEAFATLPDDEHLHVLLGEDRIRAVVASDPHACEEKWWGKKLAAVRVSLPDADRENVRALLEEAWLARRPTRAAGKRSPRGGP